MNPDAQDILDTLEENRDWYSSMITASPPGNMQTTQIEECEEPAPNRNLAAAAEKIKFQITLEEPEDEDEEESSGTMEEDS